MATKGKLKCIVKGAKRDRQIEIMMMMQFIDVCKGTKMNKLRMQLMSKRVYGIGGKNIFIFFRHTQI